MADGLFEAITNAIRQRPQAAIVAVSCAALLVFARLRRKSSTLKLRGPPSSSWIFGVGGDLFASTEPNSLYVAWSKVYGNVFNIPLPFGDQAVVLMDPKAVGAFFARDTSIYTQTPPIVKFIKLHFGDNILSAEGEDHKRHRRALSPGFSIAAIRRLVPIFLKSVHQVSDNWREVIDSNDGSSAVIDVQPWMNAVTLDGIGKGGFSHDFEASKGRMPVLQQRYEAFGKLKPSFTEMLFSMISTVFPRIWQLPTRKTKMAAKLKESIRAVALEFLEKARKEKQSEMEQIPDRSILRALAKSETSTDNIRMEVDEIMGQIHFLLHAGYETTASTLSWCIAELARQPDIQQKLRDELASLQGEDPTYDQLASNLPYLDGVVCETLRLHTPVTHTTRQAKTDDILPLSSPIVNAKGETMDHLPIPAGTRIRIPLGGVNLHEDFWGEDSHRFDPSRWIDDGTYRKRGEQVSGFRHILTFSDGPRNCIGRLFALAEIKTVLSVLVRDYSFELVNGPKTKIGIHKEFLPRPKVEGEDGPILRMIVRRVEH